MAGIPFFSKILALAGIDFKESSGNNTVNINAPSSLDADVNLTLPTTDGNANQVLSTDGSGVLSWTDVLTGTATTFTNGFVDASQTSISVADSTRTFTIAPTSGSYKYYANGKEVTISSSKSVNWSNSHGTHFFYLDENGDLNTTATYNDDLILKHAIVSILYWDDTPGAHIYFADERHGAIMSKMTHLYLHKTRGAAFESGCSLSGFQIDGTGNSNADAIFTADTGIIWDEDLKISIPSQTHFPIFHRNGGADWKRKDADDYACIYTGTAGYTGARIAYNAYTGGVWSLQPINNNKFGLTHIFATNDIENKYIGILGQAQYDSKAAAKDGAENEIKTLKDLPFSEFVPIGTILFETNSNYTNTPKARIVSTSAGQNYVDYRAQFIRPGVLA